MENHELTIKSDDFATYEKLTSPSVAADHDPILTNQLKHEKQ